MAAASRSASSRVEDGTLRPAETTTIEVMPAPAQRALGAVAGHVVGRGVHRGVLAAAGSGDQGGVGGRVGDVGRTALGEPRAHLREDLAEQVELLEHGLQRQAGVVDQEQLALVVADVVAEPQGALEHLLRGPDGQRRLLR